ncbi:MAG: hypothetical protein ACMUHY_02435 [Thermoplasmatota archaeon]
MGDDVLIPIITGIFVLLIVVLMIIVMIWLDRRRKKEALYGPVIQFRDAWDRDSDGDGIPDHVEEMLRSMEKRMASKGKPYQGFHRSSHYSFRFRSSDGSSWGKVVRDVNGKRTEKEWGEPPKEKGKRYPYEADEEKIIDVDWSEIFDDFVNGNISKAEFKRKAEELKGK